MALTPLFGGALVALWLTLGTIGWLVAALRRPARTNSLAWAAALVAALIGGPLPALLSWRAPPALLVGLLLALVAATAVALRLS